MYLASLRSDDVGTGTGTEVVAVHPGNHFRAREHQDVVIASQVLTVTLEKLAALIRLDKLAILQRSAHRAVENRNATR